MSPSTIWIVEVREDVTTLQAGLNPGHSKLDGLAISNIDGMNEDSKGFVLYANYKESDVAEETHGHNIYGEPPEQVFEHYSGMVMEAHNVGQVIRVEHRDRRTTIKRFMRGYDAGHTSLGHT